MLLLQSPSFVTLVMLLASSLSSSLALLLAWSSYISAPEDSVTLLATKCCTSLLNHNHAATLTEHGLLVIICRSLAEYVTRRAINA